MAKVTAADHDVQSPRLTAADNLRRPSEELHPLALQPRGRLAVIGGTPGGHEGSAGAEIFFISTVAIQSEGILVPGAGKTPTWGRFITMEQVSRVTAA